MAIRGAVLALLLACGIVGPTGPSEPGGGADDCAQATAPGAWQPERRYPGGVVPRVDGLELGVSGPEQVAMRVAVTGPDGSKLRTAKVQSTKVQAPRGRSIVHYVATYPADFTSAGETGARGLMTSGPYTVRWEANGSLVACDRFEVARLGAADAQSCAPSGWSAIVPGGTLVLRSGVATMSLAGASVPIGLITEPWQFFEAADQQTLTFADGSSATLYVSRGSAPKRVSAQFSVGSVPYRLEATGEGMADLVELARAVATCAQTRLR